MNPALDMLPVAGLEEVGATSGPTHAPGWCGLGRAESTPTAPILRAVRLFPNAPDSSSHRKPVRRKLRADRSAGPRPRSSLRTARLTPGQPLLPRKSATSRSPYLEHRENLVPFLF